MKTDGKEDASDSCTAEMFLGTEDEIEQYNLWKAFVFSKNKVGGTRSNARGGEGWKVVKGPSEEKGGIGE
jgi:hypothetical protein